MPANKNVRIVQLIDSLEPGGAERMAVNYANALATKISFSGLVVTRKEGGLKEFVNQEFVYLFLNKKGNFDFKALFSFRKYCIQNKITHIHAHSSSFFLATLIKATIPKIKIIWHNHLGASESLKGSYLLLLKSCSLFFNLTISVNPFLKVWTENILAVKKNIYLANFTSSHLENKHFSLLKGVEGKRILCLANLRSEKNHELLLEISVLLKKTYPDWSFHLVGKDFNDKYATKIKTKIINLGLEKNVYIYGSQNKVLSIIKQSAFGILTSISEGLPVSLLEYGIMGKTVVASNVGDVERVIINNETGILIEGFNKDEFSNAIEKLIKEREYRERLENNIKHHVESHFSEEAIIFQYLNELEYS